MPDALKKPKILIIEDDPDQRELLAEMLGLHYDDPALANITTTGSGAEALATDLAGFDVILQDYNLPDTSGLDLIVEILARADVPVIFVTGQNDSALAAQAIQRGAQDYVVKMGDYLFAIPVVIDKTLRQWALRQENIRLQRRLEETIEELRVKNDQLEQSLAQVELAATTDPLTGVANRRRFSDLLRRCYDEAFRYEHDLSCCMCDLDHYKQLNDSLGHQAGDEILRVAAQAIRQSLRRSDVVARYGGDEFVLLLPHTSTADAKEVCDRFRAEFHARAMQFGPAGGKLHISVGIASLLADRPATAEELLSHADRALLDSKESGRDRVVLHADLPPRASKAG